MAKKKEYQGADVVPEYTTNVNGVRIKKCCASCAFKQPLDANGAHRLCTLGGGKKVVFKDELCSSGISARKSIESAPKALAYESVPWNC